MAPSFIRRSRSSFIRPTVWGEWGTTSTTMSAWGSRSSSRSMGNTWSKPSTVPRTVRFSPKVRAPRPWHMAAKVLPMCPAPTTRTVLPRTHFIRPRSFHSCRRWLSR